ncbi:transporter, CPA2 family [Nannocystis exedens]|uniref:Transporter, CPA2 family n=1 Tax=Nannocystis exedens TaxID=54 RepID=A0A1I1U4H5_9BACT|nr:cation:proton antiporter [Nannocystis exedens]PCC71423.1 potassium transporter [Nannocystis exedens]SFD65669.1 transporter, CPA2 family [Nannocystis exedens]
MAFLLHSPLCLLIAQLVVIIVTARLLGLAARKIHQPLVIAEVVAGILLGPSLLGLVAPDVEAALFPAASLGILGMLSQVGLILFMFLVGLEMDLGLLRGRGHTSVLISHTSIVVPFALGAVLALYIHPTLMPEGVAFSSFTLFMGAAMSITAFPVLARILTERRLLRTKVGAVTITCAAVDDVTAWCILAFVVSIVRATALTEAIVTTVLAVAYTLGMLLLVRPFLARVAARGTGREGLTQNIVAVTFVLLFLSAWATELIGIHALFGAFLMGAIIPREGGFARVLAEKLEDIVVIVLLPTFFALSGLRTQIGLLNTPEAWIQCALIIAVACLGKFGGSYVAARWTGLGWRESTALGILMNTRGLMELIVLNIGLELGVISPTLFTMMVLMALVTTFMTTPILQVVYPPELLAADVIDPPQPDTRVTLPEGFSVLMCVAFDRSGPGMAQIAGALVGKQTASDRLYGLQLHRPAERTSTLLEDEHSPESPGALEPLLARSRDHGLNVRPMSFVSGEPARDICSVAEVKDVDLILLGWHKTLFGQALLGGTVHDVMKDARADVAVLVSRDLTAVRRVLVPFCGAPHDELAVRLARRMAFAVGAEVTILRIRFRNADAPRVDAFLAGMAADKVTVVEAVDDGNKAVDLVVKAALGQDLVVLGAAPLSPDQIMTRCPTSFLVVHHHERAQPAQRRPRPLTEPQADAVAHG